MSKRSLIDSIEVKNPCSQDWNEMKGNDTVRFCSHCDLNVNNISALTRKQAMKLMRQSNSRICVRYVKNPVDNKPVFADKLYQITRRAGIAAGVLSASLSFSTFVYAQGKPGLNKSVPQPEISQTIPSETDTKTASISGIVTDPTNAAIPNVFINLTNEDTKETFAGMTDEKGAYKFENLSAGNYKMTVNGSAEFPVMEISNIKILAGDESTQNVSLKTAEIAIVNITAETPASYEVTAGEVALVKHQTALHTAVSNDDLREVKNLIMRGDSVNAKDENYSHITPLFIAVENGNAEIAQTLLNFRAKINARDDNKQTPVMRLDEDATVELVNVLIKHGAKMNLVDNEGNTTLILASRSVKPEVLQILLGYSSNIDAQNNDGRTALMEAADADNLENVRALLLAGANVKLKDSDAETALDLTTDEEIQKLLTEYGAKAGSDSN